MTRDQLKFIQNLVKGSIRKQRKSLDKAKAANHSQAHIGNLVAGLLYRLDILHAVDEEYTRSGGQANFNSEWRDAAKGAARQFIQEQQIAAARKGALAVMDEEAYADLLDDITAEFATGIRIDLSDSPAVERFAKAVDAALAEEGHPHTYERSH